jgi:hypothetical protein
MIQLKSCEDSLAERCGKIVRQAQAASYQGDKAHSRTKVIWLHLRTERKELVMKSYRNAAAALLLALALSTSAYAGVMHTGSPDPDPEPTPAANGVMQTGAPEGEMQTGEAASTPGAADTVTESALNLLQSVFALF